MSDKSDKKKSGEENSGNLKEKMDHGKIHWNFKDQKKFNLGVTDYLENLRALIGDEKIAPTSPLILLMRKFWFRFNLYRLYKFNREKMTVLHLGSGKDKMCEGFQNWNFVRVDREKFDGVIQLDLDKDYKQLDEIVRKNGVKLVIMEGLTYYLEEQTIAHIMGLIKRKLLYFICDALDEGGIAKMKHMLEMKTPFPFDSIPPKTKVIPYSKVKDSYGWETEDESNFFFVINF